MVKRKNMKSRGKIQLSRYFQSLEKGDKVAVIRERSLHASFPERLQGRTGVVEGQRGASYVISLKDGNKEKRFIIKPIHLKKMQKSRAIGVLDDTKKIEK